MEVIMKKWLLLFKIFIFGDEERKILIFGLFNDVWEVLVR